MSKQRNKYDIDSNPLTSPENMNETRQRLTKLLIREKALRQEVEGHNIRKNLSLSPTRTIDNSNYHDENVNIVNKKPSSSSSYSLFNNTISKGYNNDTFADEEIFLRGLEAPRVEQIVQKVQVCVDKITNSCLTLSDVSRELNDIQYELIKFSFGHIQVWIEDITGSLCHTMSDNVRVNLPMYLTNVIKHISKDSKKTVNIIDHDNDIFSEIQNGMRSANNLFTGTIDSYEGNNPFKNIYAISLPSSTDNGLLCVLLASEYLNQSIPLSVTRRPSYNNVTRIRNLIALQSLEKIAFSIAFRMRVLKDDKEQSLLRSSINDENAKNICLKQIVNSSIELAEVKSISTAMEIISKLGIDAFKATMSWCIWTSADSPVRLSENGKVEYQWISISAGHASSTGVFAIQGNMTNGLFSRVLNISSNVPLILTAPISELAGIGLNEDTFTHDITLVSIPIIIDDNISDEFSLGEKKRMSKCCLLLALPSPSYQDLVIQYADMLNNIATRAFRQVTNFTKQSITNKVEKLGSFVMNSISGTSKDHMLKLMHEFQRETVTKAFGVKKCALLISDSCLKSSGSSIDNYEIKLFHAQIDHTSSKSVYSQPPQALRKVFESDGSESNSSFLWLRHLLVGNVIHVNGLHRPLIDQISTICTTVFDSVNDIPGNVYLNETAKADSEASIRKTITAVDPAAQSALLVPLRSQAGICIMVLIDKIYEIEDKVTNASYEVVPGLKGEGGIIRSFTPFDIAILKNSRICSEFESALECVLQFQTASFTYQDNDRLRNQIELLGDAMHKDKHASYVARCFSNWKLQVYKNMQKTKESKTSNMLSAAMELLKSYSFDSPNDETKLVNYLSTLESFAAKLYPYDAVVVTVGDLSSTSTNISATLGLNDNIIVVNERYEDEDIIEKRQKRSSVNLENSRTILVGYIKNYNTSKASTRKAQSGSRESDMLGTIRVTRAKGSNRIFSSEEISSLHKFCEMASEIYTAMNTRTAPNLNDGNVPGLILPLLTQLVPTILGLSLKENGDYKSTLSTLSLWLKRICGGDIAFLKLFVPSNDGSKELVSSSEDADPRIVKMTNDLSGIKELVIDENEYLSGFLNSDTVNPQSDNIALKLLRDLNDQSFIGEIKVLGSKKGFSADHVKVVNIISYILAYSLLVIQRMKKLEALCIRSNEAASQLEASITSMTRDLAIEKGSADGLRRRLSSSLALLLFASQASNLSAVQPLSNLVSEALPAIVGARGALFLILDENDENNYKAVVPVADSRRRGLPVADNVSNIPVSQLSKIPSYVDDPNSLQSKINLTKPDSRIPFGVIIIFKNSEDVGQQGERGIWQGLEDVFISTLSSVISSCLVRFSNSIVMKDMKDEIQRLESVERSKLHLQEELAKVLEIRGQIESKYNQSQLEISKLEERLLVAADDRKKDILKAEEAHEMMVVKKDAQSNSLRERIASLERDLVETRELGNIAVINREDIVALLMSFAYDNRCHQESVVQWLNDLVESRDASLTYVSQGESGILTGASGIKGVIAASGEALRNGFPVEIFTHYTNSPVSSGSSALSNLSKQYNSSLSSEQRHDNLAVLVIPNRTVSAASSNTHACFVLIRVMKQKEEGFTDLEKEFFVAAVGLTSRSLLRTSVKYNAEDFKKLETQIKRQDYLLKRFRNACMVLEVNWYKGFSSRVDVCRAIEGGASSILMEKDENPLSVDSFLWWPPASPAQNEINALRLHQGSIYTALTAQGFIGDVEIVHKVLSNSKSQRKGGLMWAPIKASDGQIIALLRIEKKLGSNLENENRELTGMQKWVSGSSNQPTISDLLMTEDEEEVLNSYCRLSLPLLDRLNYISEAYIGVQEAGQAILALQNIENSLEERVTIEVSQRLEIEEALKVGADMLGAISSMRLAKVQILDLAKKALISITSSEDCYIIMQNVADVFHPMMPGAIRNDNGLFEGDEGAIDTDPNSLYTLDSDRPTPLRVRLEKGDLEAAAIQHCKPFANPGDSSGETWQSWTVRRVQGRALTSGMGKRGNTDQIYSLAVPFVFRNSSRAVVTILRRVSPYSEIDKECVSWVAKVLVYCLEARLGDESMQETYQRNNILQQEVDRLRHADGGLAALEMDSDKLERSLNMTSIFAEYYEPSLDTYSTTFSSDSRVKAELGAESDPSELILAIAKSIFGGNFTTSITVSEAEQKLNESSANDIDRKSGSGNGITKGSIQSVHGKVSFFIIKNAIIPDDVKRIENKALPNTEAQNETLMILAVHYKGYPVTWLHINLEMTTPVLLNLRVSILLKLLDCQEKWRTKLIQTTDDFKKSQENWSMHIRDLEEERMKQERMIADLTETHKKTMTTTNEKFTVSSEVRAKQHKIGENVLTSALVCSNILRQEVELVDRKDAPAEWLRYSLLKMCEQFAVSTSSDVAVGALSIVQSKAGITGAVSASYGVTWFTNEPAVTWATGLGYGRGEVIQAGAVYAIDRTNPIHAAVSANSIVVVCSPNEEARYLSIIDEITIAQNARSAIATTVAPTSGYNSGNLIIPINLSSRNSTIVIIVKPPEGKQDKLATAQVATEVSSEVMTALLTSWCSLSVCIEDSVIFRDKLYLAREWEKTKSLRSMNRLVLLRKALVTSKQLAFTRLKLHSVSQKLSIALPILKTTRTQARQLEQSVADWTEVVKGINGASAGVNHGVGGLWTQACRTLISMVSSHVTLKSCGLFVANSLGEICELTVRELTTPLHMQGDIFNNSIELPDYARAALDMRSVSELGDRVQNIVIDMLSERSINHKLVKLTRQDVESFENHAEEQLWLVPVKTARAVLAVLRVTLETPRGNVEYQYSASQTPVRGISSEEEDADSKRSPIEAAQSNIVNFAEVLAPVLAAAQHLDASRDIIIGNEKTIKENNQLQKETFAELTSCGNETSLLCVTMTSIGDAISRELINAGPVEGLPSVLCQHLATAISDCLGASISIQLYDSQKLVPDDSVESHPAQGMPKIVASGEVKLSASDIRNEVNMIAEPLLNDSGIIFGTISLSAESFNAYTMKSKNVVNEDILKESEDRHGELVTSIGNVELKVITNLMKPIARLVSGLVCAYAREFDAKRRVVQAVNSMQVLENTIKKERQTVDELQQKELQMTSVIDFYRRLTDIINKCLLFTSTSPYTVNRYKDWNQSKLYDFLCGLCNSLPSLVSNSCIFTFAMVDDGAADITNTDINIEKKLIWMYPHDGEPQQSAPRIHLDEGTKEIANKLASASIMKRSKSSVDIGLSLEKTEALLGSSVYTNNSSGIRVLTYPLVAPVEGLESIGIMQVLLSASVDNSDIDELCDDIAKAVSCTIYDEKQKKRISSKLSSQEDNIIMVEGQRESAEMMEQVWHHRANAWKSISQAASAIIKSILDGVAVSEIVLTDYVVTQLCDAGILMSTKVVIRGAAKQNNPLVTENNIEFVVPYTESEDILVTIRCGAPKHTFGKVTADDSLEEMFNEFAETVKLIFNEVIALQQSRSAEHVEADNRFNMIHQKSDKYKTELRSMKSELQIAAKAITDLRSAIESHEKIRQYAITIINGFCAPAIREMSVMLEEVGAGNVESLFENKRVDMSWAWNGIARVADRAMARISNGTFSYHVSIVVKCKEPVEEVKDAKPAFRRTIKKPQQFVQVYDGLVTTSEKEVLPLFDENVKSNTVSSLEKCLRSGGVHEMVNPSSPIDFVGMSQKTLDAIIDEPVSHIRATDESKKSESLTAICFAIHESPQNILGILRILLPSEVKIEQKLDNPVSSTALSNIDQFVRSVIKPVLEVVSSLGGTLVHVTSQELTKAQNLETFKQAFDLEKEKGEESELQLSRTKRVHSVVNREAGVLLDLPVVGTGSTRTLHPASLTPQQASQDSCLKLLSMIRTLLRSEGQALLLRDTTTDPVTYQVIVTGNALRWPGVEQGAFGVISNRTGASIAVAAMDTHKSIAVTDAPKDQRYGSLIDGSVFAGTPLLAVPLRGRGNAVIGVVLIARGAGSSPFATEDIAAAEMVATLGSLSLYWCDGLTSGKTS